MSSIVKVLTFVIVSIAYISAFGVVNNIDSLELSLSKQKDDTNKVRTLNKLALEYEYTKNEKAIEYAQKALMLSNKIDDKKGFIESNTNLGFFFDDIGDFNKAITYYKVSLDKLIEAKEDNNAADHYNYIGLCYNYLGNYLQAIQNFQDALKIYETENDSLEMSKCLLNIGLAHYNNIDYKTAEYYFQKSLGIKLRNNDPLGSAYCYLNLGNIFQLKGKRNDALDLFLKAEGLFGKCNRPREQAYVNINIANIYKENKQFIEAKAKLIFSKKIIENVNDQNVLSLLYTNLGLTYFALDINDSTRIYLQKAVSISKDAGLLPNLKDAYMSLASVYDTLKKPDSTLKYLKLFLIIKDSIYSLEKSNQINELTTKYETEKKEQQIALQKSDLSRKDLQRNMLISGLLLVLLLVIYVYYSLLQKRSANRILLQKNTEIQQQKEEIQSQAENLSRANEELEYVNRELEKLSIVASETDNAVVISRPDGEIEWVNDGFTRLFEYTKEEFIAQFGSNIKKASNHTDIERTIQYCINNNQTVEYTTINTTKSGKKIWVQTTLTPILKEEKLFKLVAIDSDITKLKLAEEEIQQQKEELLAQSELLLQTNRQLEIKNTQITDSIRYAKQIQDALLPTEEYIKQIIPETFIIFKPKDIVSGDFYWFKKVENYIFIALVDCTGHGVPGAFMSMIGNTLLNEIVVHKKIYEPVTILEKLDEGVVYTLLKQRGEEHRQDDGMEISLCRIDTANKEIVVSNTNQPVYLITDEFREIEGGLYSIGGNLYKEKSFKSEKINYSLDTSIYLFSDGFSDLFGGEDLKKFGSQRVMEMILSAQNQSMQEQKDSFKKVLANWIGSGEQVDDITMLGLKIEAK